MGKVYLEDYSVGEKLISSWKIITEADMVLFTAWSGDCYSLVPDEEHSQGTRFGGRLAYGLAACALSLVLPLRLGPDMYIPKGFIAYYGVDNVRFTVPLKIGDIIRSELTVTSLEPRDDKRGVLVYEGKLVNKQGEQMMSNTARLLVARRPEE